MAPQERGCRLRVACGPTQETQGQSSRVGSLSEPEISHGDSRRSPRPRQQTELSGRRGKCIESPVMEAAREGRSAGLRLGDRGRLVRLR